MAPRLSDIEETLVHQEMPQSSEVMDLLLQCVRGAAVKERNVCLALAAVSLWHRGENGDRGGRGDGGDAALNGCFSGFKPSCGLFVFLLHESTLKLK